MAPRMTETRVERKAMVSELVKASIRLSLLIAFS